MKIFENVFRKDGGNVMALTALLLVALMGMTAFAVDIGFIATAKTQLQAAADASALAGASGLIVSQNEAVNRAITIASRNNLLRAPVTLSAGDISFPTVDQVRVDITQTVNLFFAPVIGMDTTDITVEAVARFGVLNGTGGLKPFAIPYDENNPYLMGQPTVIKAGALGAPGTDSGFFYPVDFPPVNTGSPISGADAYADNILNGADDMVYIGDILQVEPGNMVGPTVQAINDVIAMDPLASFNPVTGTVNSPLFQGNTSPRLLKIPFYDSNYPPDSGRNTVEITRLGAFFLESINGRDVIGRFIEITSSGTFGNLPSTIYGVSLIQ